MAIYHFSVKNVSRADGRSAVAAAAYRSGEKLIDERQGKEQDYTKKTGVEFSKIYAPAGTNPELLDRNQLWNTVEKVENRKNSQLAREFEIAFPHELNKQERQELLDDLCQEIIKRHGVVVDAAIHAPHTESGSDKRNYHAHILLTTRSIDEQGNLGKKTREFNDHGKQQVEHWREKFADLTNRHLARTGHIFVEVDHRSYKAQGLGLEATQHEGSKVTQLRRQGIDTEISLKNDAIKAKNAEKLANEQLIKGLDQEIILADKILSDLESLKHPQRELEQSGQANVHIEPKNALERKIEPSSPILKLSQPEKKQAIADFNARVSKLAKEIFENDLREILEKTQECKELSSKLLTKIEVHKQNKPLNPFKIGTWKKELSEMVNLHNNNIKVKWENLLLEYKSKENLGANYTYYEKAHTQLFKQNQDEYKKIQEFQKEIAENERQESINKAASRQN
ncbi:MobQ family relaxase, partial [Acinetobacter towneri]